MIADTKHYVSNADSVGCTFLENAVFSKTAALHDLPGVF